MTNATLKMHSQQAEPGNTPEFGESVQLVVW